MAQLQELEELAALERLEQPGAPVVESRPDPTRQRHPSERRLRIRWR